MNFRELINKLEVISEKVTLNPDGSTPPIQTVNGVTMNAAGPSAPAAAPVDDRNEMDKASDAAAPAVDPKKQQDYARAEAQIKKLYAAAQVQYPPQDEIIQQRFGLPSALPPIEQWDGTMPKAGEADFMTRNIFGRQGAKDTQVQNTRNSAENTSVEFIRTNTEKLKGLLAKLGVPLTAGERTASNAAQASVGPGQTESYNFNLAEGILKQFGIATSAKKQVVKESVEQAKVVETTTMRSDTSLFKTPTHAPANLSEGEKMALLRNRLSMLEASLPAPGMGTALKNFGKDLTTTAEKPNSSFKFPNTQGITDVTPNMSLGQKLGIGAAGAAGIAAGGGAAMLGANGQPDPAPTASLSPGEEVVTPPAGQSGQAIPGAVQTIGKPPGGSAPAKPPGGPAPAKPPGGPAPAKPPGGPAPAKPPGGVTWQEIYNMNKDVIGSNPNLIKPGQELKMPDGSTYTVKPGDNLSAIAKRSASAKPTTPTDAAATPTDAAADASKVEPATPEQLATIEEIKGVMSQLADIDDPEVAKLLGDAQAQIEKFSASPAAKADPAAAYGGSSSSEEQSGT